MSAASASSWSSRSSVTPLEERNRREDRSEEEEEDQPAVLSWGESLSVSSSSEGKSPYHPSCGCCGRRGLSAEREERPSRGSEGGGEKKGKQDEDVETVSAGEGRAVLTAGRGTRTNVKESAEGRRLVEKKEEEDAREHPQRRVERSTHREPETRADDEVEEAEAKRATLNPPTSPRSLAKREASASSEPLCSHEHALSSSEEGSRAASFLARATKTEARHFLDTAKDGAQDDDCFLGRHERERRRKTSEGKERFRRIFSDSHKDQRGRPALRKEEEEEAAPAGFLERRCLSEEEERGRRGGGRAKALVEESRLRSVEHDESSRPVWRDGRREKNVTGHGCSSLGASKEEAPRKRRMTKQTSPSLVSGRKPRDGRLLSASTSPPDLLRGCRGKRRWRPQGSDGRRELSMPPPVCFDPNKRSSQSSPSRPGRETAPLRRLLSVGGESLDLCEEFLRQLKEEEREEELKKQTLLTTLLGPSPSGGHARGDVSPCTSKKAFCPVSATKPPSCDNSPGYLQALNGEATERDEDKEGRTMAGLAYHIARRLVRSVTDPAEKSPPSRPHEPYAAKSLSDEALSRHALGHLQLEQLQERSQDHDRHPCGVYTGEAGSISALPQRLEGQEACHPWNYRDKENSLVHSLSDGDHAVSIEKTDLKGRFHSFPVSTPSQLAPRLIPRPPLTDLFPTGIPQRSPPTTFDPSRQSLAEKSHGFLLTREPRRPSEFEEKEVEADHAECRSVVAEEGGRCSDQYQAGPGHSADPSLSLFCSSLVPIDQPNTTREEGLDTSTLLGASQKTPSGQAGVSSLPRLPPNSLLPSFPFHLHSLPDFSRAHLQERQAQRNFPSPSALFDKKLRPFSSSPPPTLAYSHPPPSSGPLSDYPQPRGETATPDQAEWTKGLPSESGRRRELPHPRPEGRENGRQPVPSSSSPPPFYGAPLKTGDQDREDAGSRSCRRGSEGCRGDESRLSRYPPQQHGEGSGERLFHSSDHLNAKREESQQEVLSSSSSSSSSSARVREASPKTKKESGGSALCVEDERTRRRGGDEEETERDDAAWTAGACEKENIRELLLQRKTNELRMELQALDEQERRRQYLKEMRYTEEHRRYQKSLRDLRAKYRRLVRDFVYNLNLLKDRDAALERAEKEVDTMVQEERRKYEAALREKENQIVEILSLYDTRNRELRDRCRSSVQTLTEKMKNEINMLGMAMEKKCLERQEETERKVRKIEEKKQKLLLAQAEQNAQRNLHEMTCKLRDFEEKARRQDKELEEKNQELENIRRLQQEEMNKRISLEQEIASLRKNEEESRNGEDSARKKVEDLTRLQSSLEAQLSDLRQALSGNKAG